MFFRRVFDKYILLKNNGLVVFLYLSEVFKKNSDLLRGFKNDSADQIINFSPLEQEKTLKEKCEKEVFYSIRLNKGLFRKALYATSQADFLRRINLAQSSF